jgi:hypothetical protein
MFLFCSFGVKVVLQACAPLSGMGIADGDELLGSSEVSRSPSNPVSLTTTRLAMPGPRSVWQTAFTVMLGFDGRPETHSSDQGPLVAIRWSRPRPLWMSGKRICPEGGQFLAKPWRFDELADMLRELIGGRQG